MAIVSSATPGAIGLVLDTAPAELPPEAWSFAENIRFANSAAQVMLGDQQLAISTAQLEYALPTLYGAGEGASWLLASGTKAWAWENPDLTEVTPSGVTGLVGTGLNWSGGTLGQVTFLNNGLQKPWAWMSNDPLTLMVELANWPASTTAQCLRSFKQYLVALDVTKGVSRYPTLVKWSHPADPGTVPVSWDETDPTRDAGEHTLSETPGVCVDSVPLRDVNIIYKTDSVWGMQLIGGVFVFRFYKIFGDFGAAKMNCAVEYSSGKHFVFTGTDVMIHDGTSARSITTNRVKSLFKLISSTQLLTCYVVAHPAMNEVWLCWRRAEDNVLAADTALIYNHSENTWTLRKLPDYRYIAPGRVEQAPTDVTWDDLDDTSSWEEDGILWGETENISSSLRLLGLGTLSMVWVDGLVSGMSTAKLERTYVGIPIRSGKPPDLSVVKFVSRVWPRIKGTAGTKLKITFGVANSVAKEPVWKAVKTFTIGTTEKLDLTLTGKMMAIRLEIDPTSPVQSAWSYHGMDIDVQPVGEN